MENELTEHRTFLYTWNPRKWPPIPNPLSFATDVKDEILKQGTSEHTWRSGRKDVTIGDRVFIRRLGPSPTGIIASGRISGPSDENDGQLINRMSLDTFQDIEAGDLYINDDDLKRLGDINWSPQRGGVEIPREIALKLEQIWEGIVRDSHLAVKISEFDQELAIAANELVQQGEPTELAGLEGGRRSVTVTRVERNSVNRQACLNHWGYKCRVCDFDFGKTFGSVAEEFIHVHHHNLVAVSGEIIPDPINDMSPLCPNCHAVAHLKRPPYRIEELKAMRESSKLRS